MGYNVEYYEGGIPINQPVWKDDSSRLRHTAQSRDSPTIYAQWIWRVGKSYVIIHKLGKL